MLLRCFVKMDIHTLCAGVRENLAERPNEEVRNKSSRSGSI